ncbi:hypothetical protein [Spirochaeta cellobiosiphila]|uniref:hypothetical protein n=1 Tax=Spirochaeta cellobiosiphila TaxID=504483 RepID=UPI0004920A2B|nr:hypothetical protein [Spirochaeta cellobiosiphila]
MFYEEFYLVYPEGDTQEIQHTLSFGDLVGLNGNSITLPLTTSKQIVYRVSKITRKELKGSNTIYYFLEQIIGRELESLSY